MAQHTALGAIYGQGNASFSLSVTIPANWQNQPVAGGVTEGHRSGHLFKPFPSGSSSDIFALPGAGFRFQST
jgi:hypothetical protein